LEVFPPFVLKTRCSNWRNNRVKSVNELYKIVVSSAFALMQVSVCSKQNRLFLDFGTKL